MNTRLDACGLRPLVAALGLLAVGSPGPAVGQGLDTLWVLGGIEERGGFSDYVLRDGVILPESRVAIAQRDGVYLVSPTGRVEQIAREGEGPGEVGAVQALAYDEDSASLRWFDTLLRRLTVFEIEGGAVRTRALNEFPSSAIHTPVSDSAVVSLTHREFQQSRAAGRTPVGLSRITDTVDISWHDHEGRSRMIAAFERGVVYRVTTEGMRSRYVAPGTPSLLLDLRGEWAAFGMTSGDSVVVLNLRTGARSTRAVSVEPRPMDRMTYRALEDEFMGASTRGAFIGGQDLDPEGPLAQVLRAAPIPEFAPNFEDIVAGSDGSTWIREFARPLGDQVSWRIVSADGAETRIRIPADLEIVDVREDQVLAWSKDEFDTRTVYLLELRR